MHRFEDKLREAEKSLGVKDGKKRNFLIYNVLLKYKKTLIAFYKL